jgi:peroxiredoxin
MSNRLQVGDAAPNIALVDVQGETVNLSTKYQGKLTLVSFLRHFG